METLSNTLGLGYKPNQHSRTLPEDQWENGVSGGVCWLVGISKPWSLSNAFGFTCTPHSLILIMSGIKSQIQTRDTGVTSFEAGHGMTRWSLYLGEVFVLWLGESLRYYRPSGRVTSPVWLFGWGWGYLRSGVCPDGSVQIKLFGTTLDLKDLG